MLDKEFNFYINNQDELLKKYNGEYIVIIGEEVIGSFKSQLEAYNETAKEHKVGTFLIQHCLPGKDSYTQIFHSRVIINAA